MRYEIGGRVFEQKKLVLGQVRQIAELLEDVDLVKLLSENIDGFIKVIGRKLPRFLAIVLREEGKPLSEKNVDELEKFIEENADLDIALEIVRDFFACNDIPSLIQKTVQTTQTAQEGVSGTGSKSSSSSSPTATSQRENTSSGTSH